jgi:hypothetical protein
MRRFDLISVIARFGSVITSRLSFGSRYDMKSRRDAHLARLEVGSKAAELHHQSRRTGGEHGV